MSNLPPTLSVVLPSYNHMQFIGEALEAIVNQSVTPNELIIIDDASTDNSINIIKSFAEKYSWISLYENPVNIGVIPTLNRGLEIATGNYIFFSASDDVLFPDFIEKTMKMLNLYPSAGLCSAMTRIIDEKSVDKGAHSSIVIRNTNSYISPQQAKKYFMRTGNWIQSNTTVYYRNRLLEEGGFPEDILSYTDSYINIIISLKYGACFIPEYLGVWRRLKTSFSSQNSRNSEEFYNIISRVGILFKKKNFDLHLIKAWKKRMLYLYLIDSQERAVEDCVVFLNSLSRSEEGKAGKSLYCLCEKILKITQISLKIILTGLLNPCYFLYLVRNKLKKNKIEERTYRPLA